MAGSALRRRVAAEDGQALVEYALVLVLVSIVSVGVLTALGSGVDQYLGLVLDAL